MNKMVNGITVKCTPAEIKEIEARGAKWKAGEPKRLMAALREQRNQLLSATDWQATSDRIITAEQKDYRQSLRDLPSTSSPALDEDGQLIGITWPTNPKE